MFSIAYRNGKNRKKRLATLKNVLFNFNNAQQMDVRQRRVSYLVKLNLKRGQLVVLVTCAILARFPVTIYFNYKISYEKADLNHILYR